MHSEPDVICSACGAANRPARMKCYRCGGFFLVTREQVESLNRRAVQPPPETPDSPSRLDTSTGWTTRVSHEYSHQTLKEISRTEIGLLIIVVGLIISALPIVTLVGGIIQILGAILVIIGRGPFGKKHSGYVGVATGLYVVCSIVLFITVVDMASTVRAAFYVHASGGSSSELSARMSDLFNGYIVIVTLLGLLLVFARVLFTYAIQDFLGRLLLWLAFLASVLVTIPNIVLGSQIPNAIDHAIATSDSSQLENIVNQLVGWHLLAIIPSIVFVIAYWKAYTRVRDGFVPEK